MTEQVCRNVLIVEDSSAVQDLLKLILVSRGHEVTIAEDGMEALKKLMEVDYDIALVDFRLPMLTGLEVCEKFLLEREESEPIPCLICMTGNVDGFLREPNGTRVFERVLAKPLDIDAIVPLIEEPDNRSRPRVRKQARDTDEYSNGIRYYRNLDGELLHYPEDFHGDPASSEVEARLALRGAPDAILITQPIDAETAGTLTKLHTAQATPIIDMSGTLGIAADITRDGDEPLQTQVEKVISNFTEMRMKISKDALQSRDEEVQLLTRIFTLGGKLDIGYDGSTIEGIRYKTLMEPTRIWVIANRLCEKGLLEAQYFDRLLNCPKCRSSRLSAREECCSCSSTDLLKTEYVHHFKCATLAPEPTFLVDEELICPKCSRALKQLGEDYDKPGEVLMCNQCSAANSEADITFLCLDCATRTPGEAINSKDVYTYTITERGEDMIINGLDDKARTSRKLILSNLPMDLVADINKAAASYMSSGSQFQLGCATFRNARQLEWKSGHSTVSNAMREICEDVSNTLGSKVENWALVNDTASFLLTQGSLEENQTAINQTVMAAAKRQSALAFDVRATCMSPEDLF